MRQRKKVLLPNSVLDVTLESCSMISPSSSAVPNYIYNQEVQKLTLLNYKNVSYTHECLSQPPAFTPGSCYGEII